METLNYIKEKYGLRFKTSMPIALPIEREKLFPALLGELGFKIGAEIGVSKGRYSKWLFHGIKGLKLYCIDPWEVYDEYTELHDKSGQPMFDGYYEETKERLKNYNAELIRKYSMDAVKDFEDNSLDFVFIDGNHSFEYVIEDIVAWSKKVRSGGIISGHDYWNSSEKKKSYKIGLNLEHPTDPMEIMKLCQVKDAVDAWTKTNQIKPWFITREFHWVNGSPSWFWVKP